MRVVKIRGITIRAKLDCAKNVHGSEVARKATICLQCTFVVQTHARCLPHILSYYCASKPFTEKEKRKKVAHITFVIEDKTQEKELIYIYICIYVGNKEPTSCRVFEQSATVFYFSFVTITKYFIYNIVTYW